MSALFGNTGFMNFPFSRRTRIPGALLMGLVLIAPVTALFPAQSLPTAVAVVDDPQPPISPVGYPIVDGKQDTNNPIENSDLLKAPDYDSTSSSLGTHWADERVIDDDDRAQIEDTTRAPYRWIGKIEFTHGNAGKAHCTGALVGSDTVLTAGHCFAQGASDIVFKPGLNADTEHFPAAHATEVWYDKNGPRIGNDWAIMKLDEPVGNEVGWFGMTIPTDEFLTSAEATVIGYPGDKPAGTVWQDRDKVVKYTDTVVNYLADTFNGQSGAPVIDNKAVIYGIHNGGAMHNGGQRITKDLFSAIVNISELD